MKKVIALVLSLVIAISLVGCASKGGSTSGTGNTPAADTSSNAPAFDQTIEQYCTAFNEVFKEVCTETQSSESFTLDASTLNVNSDAGIDYNNAEINGSKILSVMSKDGKVTGVVVSAEVDDEVAYDVYYTAGVMALTGDKYSKVKAMLDKAKEESASYDHYSKYINGYEIKKLSNETTAYYTADAMTEDEYNAKENLVVPEE